MYYSNNLYTGCLFLKKNNLFQGICYCYNVDGTQEIFLQVLKNQFFINIDGVTWSWLTFLVNRPLYDLCQMFPEAASDSIKFILRDAAHDMEGVIEVKGRATFPGLDMVTNAYC